MLDVIAGGTLDAAETPQSTTENAGGRWGRMMPRASTVFSAFAPIAFAAPAFAHPGHLGHLGHEHMATMDLVEAGADMVPIVVVLGIGALAWLWNHRPQPAAAGARKPPQKGGDRRKR